MSRTPDEPPDWYESADGTMQQGDLLQDFPALIPRRREGGDWGLNSVDSTVAILTQSCDLLKQRQDIVLLVVVIPFRDLKEQDENAKSNGYKKSLLQGTAIADFLLPPMNSGGDWLVATFRNVISVPKAYLLDHDSNRTSLKTPYREHFAQAYARFVMRVGLPSGLQNCHLD